MDFTSLEFLFVFLPIFILVYTISKQPKTRLIIIAFASLLFILNSNPIATAFWLLTITLIAYTAGLALEKSRQKELALKTTAWIGITSTLFILIVFKMFVSGYGDGRINSLICERSFLLFLCNSKAQHLIVPIGISYITFQSISYIIDVYRNRISHEKDFIKFISYSLFFPKLPSGPITSYKSIADQLNTLDPTINDIADGIRRIFSGVIKRIMIANQVGIVADAVFGMPISGITPQFAWLGILAYSVQIYFDFSGYTDIAIGLARTMGIKLPENFNDPYIAQSISDFWRRWHITLSSWFREYVFYPLERRRLKFIGRQFNILTVFLLTGLWHGFTPTFIVWGLIHGIFIAFESTIGMLWLNKIFRPFRHLYTLLIVLLGWVFFRSPNLTFAFSFIGRLFGNSMSISALPFSQTTPLPFIEPTFVLALIAGIVFSMPVFSTFKKLKEKVEEKSASVIVFQITQDILLILFFVLAIAAQLAGSFAPNIYAKF